MSASAYHYIFRRKRSPAEWELITAAREHTLSLDTLATQLSQLPPDCNTLVNVLTHVFLGGRPPEGYPSHEALKTVILDAVPWFLHPDVPGVSMDDPLGHCVSALVAFARLTQDERWDERPPRYLPPRGLVQALEELLARYLERGAVLQERSKEALQFLEDGRLLERLLGRPVDAF